MKAMILKKFSPIEQNPLELTGLPVPEPAPGEILLHVRTCGVCHTDLHTIEGELPRAKLPVIPGHQVVGTVKKSGEGALRFKKGARVGAAWLFEACGECSFCVKGNENLCEKARFTGYSANGGYAEFMRVPEKFVYPIPDVFLDEEASPLLCAGIIGYRALRLSEIKPGQRLGLIGFGASAHVAIQVARHWKCKVFVFTRSEKHRALARKLGAVWTGDLNEALSEKMDSIVNFTPAGETVPAGMRLLEKGGTQALAGIYMSPIPEMDYTEHLYHERRLRSVANATRQDGKDLVHIAAQIPVRPITEVFALRDANRALQLLKKGKINGAAVLKINE